jgi:hypothetical protein
LTCLYKEASCTEPFPSVRVPCFEQIDLSICPWQAFPCKSKSPFLGVSHSKVLHLGKLLVFWLIHYAGEKQTLKLILPLVSAEAK